MRINHLIAAAAVGAMAIGSGLAALPASAQAGDVIRTGSCSAGSNWKLKSGARDAGLETEFEVDSNVNGQTWNWRLLENGTKVASGSAMTVGPSGSFTIRRVLANPAGTDTLVGRAVNPVTGEICRGQLKI